MWGAPAAIIDAGGGALAEIINTNDWPSDPLEHGGISCDLRRSMIECTHHRLRGNDLRPQRIRDIRAPNNFGWHELGSAVADTCDSMREHMLFWNNRVSRVTLARRCHIARAA